MPFSNGTIAGPQARMTPNVPLGSLYERKPRQKAQLYQPLQRSYSTPRETMESYGRKVRDFGSSTKFAAPGRRRMTGLIHRHSFDALSMDDSHDSRGCQRERLLSSFPTNIENSERHHSVELRISQVNTGGWRRGVKDVVGHIETGGANEGRIKEYIFELLINSCFEGGICEHCVIISLAMTMRGHLWVFRGRRTITYLISMLCTMVKTFRFYISFPIHYCVLG